MNGLKLLSILTIFCLAGSLTFAEDGERQKEAAKEGSVQQLLRDLEEGKFDQLPAEARDAMKRALQSAADATEDAKKTSENLKSRRFGRAIIIHPDGNKHEFFFGDEAPADQKLGVLPKEVQERFDRVRKRQADLKTFTRQRVTSNVNGEEMEVIIEETDESDGLDDVNAAVEEARKKAEEARKRAEEALNRQRRTLRSLSGKLMTVGPDGEVQEFPLGEEFKTEDLPVSVRWNLGTVLGQVPREQSRQRDLKEQSSIEEKLDLILQRLEKLESEVEDLKK